MMRLTYPLLEEAIEFRENVPNVLILESQKCFREFREQIKFQTMKLESKVSVSKDFQDVVFNRYIEVIFSPFDVDTNNKKILSKIYAELSGRAVEEEMYSDTLEINAAVSAYLSKLIQRSDCILTYDEINIEMLLKSTEVKIENDGQSLLEYISNYVDLISEYFGTNIFLFFDLKEYLEEEELVALYKHCNYMKQNLLLCENVFREPLIYEKTIIIDKDLCQIY